MRDRKIRICEHDELAEKQFRIFPIVYKGKPHSGFIYRFNDEVHAFLNQCVHMPRNLNCESPTIFDQDKKYLRCSMHGIVYDPENGQSVSTMCNGESLQALRLYLSNNTIYINDKHVQQPIET